VRMDRACVSHKHLGRVLRTDPLERMGRVYERCVRMDLVCGLQEGIGVVAVAVAGRGRCSRSGRIRRILLDCYLHVSDIPLNTQSRLTRVLRIASLDTTTACS